MKNQHLPFVLLVPLLAVPASHAQDLDWQSVQKLSPGTLLVVKTHQWTACTFQGATDDKLFCSQYFTKSDFQMPPDDRKPLGSRMFNREAIQSVRTIDSLEQYENEYIDESGDPLVVFLAAEAGGGLDLRNQPTSFAGVKVPSLVIGLASPFSMDLQYDRLSAQNGFSIEGSAELPIFRVPAFRPGNDHLHFRVFAEPGVGYRAGGGPFGGYTSAKALMLLGSKWFQDGGPSPYIEFQRRFPFNSPLDGDNRIAIGIMSVLCEHCPLD